MFLTRYPRLASTALYVGRYPITAGRVSLARCCWCNCPDATTALTAVVSPADVDDEVCDDDDRRMTTGSTSRASRRNCFWASPLPASDDAMDPISDATDLVFTCRSTAAGCKWFGDRNEVVAAEEQAGSGCWRCDCCTSDEACVAATACDDDVMAGDGTVTELLEGMSVRRRLAGMSHIRAPF